jgi:hypothetical protein
LRIPNLQKDKDQQSLISSVYNNLSNIAQTLNPQEDMPLQNEIRFVSFEEALKELKELKSS